MLNDPPAYLELSLFWHTKGKGTKDVGIIDTIRIDNPGTLGGRHFKFLLPHGPYSFSGKLISIIWALELTLPRGRNAAHKEITLSADGREIVCTACDDPYKEWYQSGLASAVFKHFGNNRD